MTELRRGVQQRRLALLVEIGDGDVVVLHPEGVDILLRHGCHFRVLQVELLDQIWELGPSCLLIRLVLLVQGIPVDGLVVIVGGHDDGDDAEGESVKVALVSQILHVFTQIVQELNE